LSYWRLHCRRSLRHHQPTTHSLLLLLLLHVWLLLLWR
jgi:hypothetical protein